LILQITFVSGQRKFKFFWCTVWWVWKVKQRYASHLWMNNMKKSRILIMNLILVQNFVLYICNFCVFLLTILPHLFM
jgi:hypothetical protein